MAMLLSASEHDIGGLNVKRILPHMQKRMVGPFIFFDHMGPTDFDKGEGIDVRPHPHIGLSTLTYLFKGSILHRDSLGNHLEIAPGDVNWMTAGKGIVHSERETVEVRADEHSINGLQCWVALPEQYAEIEPAFTHVKKQHLPHLMNEGLMIRLIVGEAYGMSSSIKTYSPMFYLDVLAHDSNQLEIPHKTYETAIYVIYGSAIVAGKTFQTGDFVLLEAGEESVSFSENSRIIMLGGEKFEQAPFIHWNFVSFSKERIEQAKVDWQAGKFPIIPDDKNEFIPYK